MMNLQKDTWGTKKIGELCKVKGGKRLPKGHTLVEQKTPYPYIRITDFVRHSVNSQNILYLLEEDYARIKNYFITKDDVFVSIAGTIGIIGVVPELLDGANLTENAARLIIQNKDELDRDYLMWCLLSGNSQRQIQANTAKTAQPKLGLIKIINLSIPIPPIDEQQRIAELFQSVEQSIVYVEEQEKNLKLLQKTLSNGLASNPPVFGNLLSEENCTPCVFDDICDCIEQHDKTPIEDGLIYFVGLENIESENFTLQGFGNIEDGTTFTKCFSKGDVLFGKRRAYLKKVAVADFDGICSSDILVFRAKAKTMLPELLPYYASSDAFMHHAVSTSAGSLSPRTKWKDLAGFQLSIPDIKTQEKIVDTLKQLSQSLQLLGQQKESLKRLKQRLLNEILE